MDAETARVLSDIAIVLGGLATGVLVAKITPDRTRDQAREQRVLDLCAVFLRGVEKMRDQGQRQVMGQPMEDFTAAQDEAHSALTQLRIVAPRLEKPALEVWQAVQKIVTGAQLRAYAGGREIPLEAQDPDKLDADYLEVHGRFLKAARR